MSISRIFSALPAAPLVSTLLFVGSITSASSTVTGVTIDATESGGDVVFTLSGSLDLTGMSPSFGGTNITSAAINPLVPWVSFAPDGFGFYDAYVGAVAAPAPFGDDGIAYPDTSVGDVFSPHGGGVWVPVGYAGENLSASMTFSDSTFDALGLNPGVYTWALPNDTVTLNIIPEPTTFTLLGLGSLALVMVRRRR